MAQRQFRSDDTDTWTDKYGSGADGARTISASETDATANTTLTGTGGGTSATAGSGTGFAAGDLVLIHQTQGTGAGNWELNKISSVGGGTNWTMAYNLINTYGSGAQVLLLKEHTTLAINSSVVVTGRSWVTANGYGGIVAYLADTSITVSGRISVAGNNGQQNSSGDVLGVAGVGFIGGTGKVPAGTGGYSGESSTGGMLQQTAANGMAGGGGIASTGVGAGDGGGGGHAASGETGRVQGNLTGGAGGGTGGVAGLTTMVFGGAGGGAGSGGSGDPKSSGGSSGGIIVLIAPTITLQTDANVLKANGGDPGGGGQNGGGGAGGSILLKGIDLTLGTALATATKGTNGNPGGDGSAGRIHADYGTSGSLSGTTDPTLDSRQDSALDLGINYTKEFNETVTVSDTIVKTVTKTFSETITITDSIVKSISKTFSDTFSITDTIEKILNKISQIPKYLRAYLLPKPGGMMFQKDPPNIGVGKSVNEPTGIVSGKNKPGVGTATSIDKPDKV